MLLIFTLLWLAGLTLTVYKRDRQLKRIVKKLNQYLYEQEIEKAKGKEGLTEEGSDNDTGKSATKS